MHFKCLAWLDGLKNDTSSFCELEGLRGYEVQWQGESEKYEEGEEPGRISTVTMVCVTAWWPNEGDVGVVGAEPEAP
jgi:hypothetical protein